MSPRMVVNVYDDNGNVVNSVDIQLGDGVTGIGIKEVKRSEKTEPAKPVEKGDRIVLKDKFKVGTMIYHEKTHHLFNIYQVDRKINYNPNDVVYTVVGMGSSDYILAKDVSEYRLVQVGDRITLRVSDDSILKSKIKTEFVECSYDGIYMIDGFVTVLGSYFGLDIVSGEKTRGYKVTPVPESEYWQFDMCGKRCTAGRDAESPDYEIFVLMEGIKGKVYIAIGGSGYTPRQQFLNNMFAEANENHIKAYGFPIPIFIE